MFYTEPPSQHLGLTGMLGFSKYERGCFINSKPITQNALSKLTDSSGEFFLEENSTGEPKILQFHSSHFYLFIFNM